MNHNCCTHYSVHRDQSICIAEILLVCDTLIPHMPACIVLMCIAVISWAAPLPPKRGSNFSTVTNHLSKLTLECKKFRFQSCFTSLRLRVSSGTLPSMFSAASILQSAKQTHLRSCCLCHSEYMVAMQHATGNVKYASKLE